MFGDEPDWFFRRHPVEMIESGQIYRTRIAAQRPFAAQVEINIEIAHGQLAQAAINRLAITAAGEVRFRHCAPMAAHFENRDNMIGVLFGFQIEDQGGNPMTRSAAAAKIPPSRHDAVRSCRTFFGDRAV